MGNGLRKGTEVLRVSAPRVPRWVRGGAAQSQTHTDKCCEQLAAPSPDDGVLDLLLGNSCLPEHGGSVGVHLGREAQGQLWGTESSNLWLPGACSTRPPDPGRRAHSPQTQGVGQGWSLTESFPQSSMALASTTRPVTCLRRAPSWNSSQGRRARRPRQAARSSSSSDNSAVTSAVPRSRCSA